MNILLSREAEDVLKRYNELLPWDKKDVCNVALNWGLNREEVAEQWGLCEYSDIDIDALIDRFWADDILDHMDEYDVANYASSNSYIVNKVVGNMTADEIVSASNDDEGLLDEIERQNPTLFNDWLRNKFEEIWCSRPEEEWEAMKEHIENGLKNRNDGSSDSLSSKN